ncbi:hypothetical protein N7447_003793 [Penicillium robsamsonii]|uniref:uncharacterized protein n=1 Tax=Penicillium robsamsonii TaxID=1792511 RepID=UPI002546CF9E|nr:uncharacterized protein N7447_003793 [Penicillium robsamsonii]KAJ5827030.1 hypothetical protein N7447_003793 [Penicillium robsamsonii]
MLTDTDGHNPVSSRTAWNMEHDHKGLHMALSRRCEGTLKDIFLLRKEYMARSTFADTWNGHSALRKELCMEDMAYRRGRERCKYGRM